MSKKIFRSIWLAALIVLVLSLVLIMGVLYSYFTGVQQKQLRTGAEVVAQGVTLDGKEFFDGLTAEDYRITWIDADGTVLYDNQSDASSMENHLMRAEVQPAKVLDIPIRWPVVICTAPVCSQMAPSFVYLRHSIRYGCCWSGLLSLSVSSYCWHWCCPSSWRPAFPVLLWSLSTP